MAFHVSLDQVFTALEKNHANTGGAFIERAQEQYVIRGEGLVESVGDVDNIVVATTSEGTPVFVKNLGETVLVPQVRQGAVTRDGRSTVEGGHNTQFIGVIGIADRPREGVRATLDRLRATDRGAASRVGP